MGSSELEQTRQWARLDEVIRGMLPAAQQRDRLERRRTLACVHPIDGSRGSVSTPQERPGHEARLAPEGTSRTRPYPRLLCCLCSLENSGPVVPTRRPCDEPRKIFAELQQISLVDVVLPTRADVSIRKRCVSRPTEHQTILLQHLGLQMPSHIEFADL